MKHERRCLWAITTAIAGLSVACTTTTCRDSDVKPFCGDWEATFVDIADPDEHILKDDLFSIGDDIGVLVARPKSEHLKTIWPETVSLKKNTIAGKVCLSSKIDIPHSHSGVKADKKHLILFYMGKDKTGDDELVACFSQDDLTVHECNCEPPSYHAGAAHSHPPT